jgi:Tripartite tricarboxylate transporter TctB family
MLARRFEIVTSIVLFMLSAGMAFVAARMPSGTIAMPGPGLVPLVLAVLLAIASLVHTVLCFQAVPKQAVAAQSELDPAVRWRITVMLAAIAGAAVLFERIGYFPTATLFLFVMLLSLSKLGWWRSGVAALAGAWVSLLCFRDVLGVALPRVPFELPF